MQKEILEECDCGEGGGVYILFHVWYLCLGICGWMDGYGSFILRDESHWR